jgi:hypothetical protein
VTIRDIFNKLFRSTEFLDYEVYAQIVEDRDSTLWIDRVQKRNMRN